MPSAMIQKEFRSAAQDRVLQAILLLIFHVYSMCVCYCTAVATITTKVHVETANVQH